MNRLTHWFAHSPGMVYAVSVWAQDEAGARAELRSFLGVNRLRAGSCVWRRT